MTRIAETNRKRGWLVVAICFVAMGFTFGARSSISMALPLWREEMGWTVAQSSTGASLVLLMMALGSPVAGNLMDRFGARIVIACGLFALGVGVGGTAHASQPWHYYLLFGGVAGVGYASVSIPMVTAAVSGYFVKYRGLAIGIAVSGASGGQLPVLSLLGILIASLGWRSTYQILGFCRAGAAAFQAALGRSRRYGADARRGAGRQPLGTVAVSVRQPDLSAAAWRVLAMRLYHRRGDRRQA